jgi:hypothetical protein
MNRLYRLLVGLGILGFVLAGVAWGQTGPREGKGGESGGQYNPQTVVTVSGIVVSKTRPSVQQGLPYLVYLTVETEAGQTTVFLGPNLYLDQLPVEIKALDRIQVTGSKTTWAGRTVILAAEVKKGDQVLKLRDPNGVPLWSGRNRN